MKQFRKKFPKPEVVKAIQYTPGTFDYCIGLLGEACDFNRLDQRILLRDWLRGDRAMRFGDWILSLSDGHFTAMSNMAFTDTYEPVEEESVPAQAPVNTCTPEEAAPPALTFKACVVHVGDNKALNALVQRELFARGYRWTAHGQKVMFTESPEIITDEKGCMYRQSTDASKRRFDLTADFLQEWLKFLDEPAGVSIHLSGDLKAVQVEGIAGLGGAFKIAVHMHPDVIKREIFLNAWVIDAIYAASQKARQK